MLIILVAVIGVATVFYSAAKHLLFELDVHALAVKSHELRNSQIKRLQQLRGLDGWDSAELVLDPGIEGAIEQIAQGEAVEAVELDEDAFAKAA